MDAYLQHKRQHLPEYGEKSRSVGTGLGVASWGLEHVRSRWILALGSAGWKDSAVCLLGGPRGRS